MDPTIRRPAVQRLSLCSSEFLNEVMELSKEEIICGTNEHKRDEMVGKDDFTDSRSSDSRSTVPTWGSFNVIRGDTNRERLDKVAAHPETANRI